VDKLITQLNGEPDLQKQNQLVTQIEKILWDDLATIPVFAFPGSWPRVPRWRAWCYNPTQNGLTWNAHQWNTAR
jgi:peptide/nickel transport system substrate-binding protein